MADLPFSVDVIRLLTLLTHGSTESEIESTLRANSDVMRFAMSNTNSSLKSQPATEDSKVTLQSGTKNSMSGHSDEEVIFFSICKIKPTKENKEELRPRLVIITDMTFLLEGLNDDLGSTRKRYSHRMTGIATDINDHFTTKVVSCVLISKRKGVTGSILFGVDDLYIQSIDPYHPLDALQKWLQHVYEPMLRYHKHQQMLWNQVQDLLSVLRSVNQVLTSVVIKRFVSQDLLELCAANPNLDVSQLMDRLGVLARDSTYIRHALEVRNRCKTVLRLEDVLSGSRCVNNHINLENDRYSDAVMKKDEDVGASIWVVQESLSYWRHVYLWIEDVSKQLQSREWRLLHRLIGSRVETNYILEYAEYSKKVRQYIRYLESIPEKSLSEKNLTFSELGKLAEAIFAAVMSPESGYPPKLTEALLYDLVSSIATCWVRLMEKVKIVDVDDVYMTTIHTASGARRDKTSWHMGPLNHGSRSGLPDSGSYNSVTEGGLEGSLQILDLAMRLVKILQKRFTESAEKLQAQQSAVLGSRQKKAEHPRLAALHRRCLDVRNIVEYNFLLLVQLRHVFIDNVHQLHCAKAKAATSTTPKATVLPEINRTNRDVGHEFLRGINTAYRRFVQATLEEYENPQATEQRNDVIGRVLWSVTPSSQQYFDAAVQKYQVYIAQCDEVIAELVSNLLSAEQSISSGVSLQQRTLRSGEEVVGGGPDARPPDSGSVMLPFSVPSTSAKYFGLHLFRIFADFRFLNLDKVQKVLRSYTAPLAEKIALHFKYIQEEYINVNIAKREAGFAVARHHLSPLMAQIMWDQRLDEALRQCLVRYDYLLENGWHHLLSLRNVEHLWRLNEPLAQCFGLLLTDLVTTHLPEDSVVHGSAYALAYLQLFHAQDELEWLSDPYIEKAVHIVLRTDPSLLQAAKNRLLALGAGAKNRDQRSDLQSTRSVLLTIEKRLEAKLLNWTRKICDEISSLFLCNTGSNALQNVLFSVIELPISASAHALDNRYATTPILAISRSHSLSTSSTSRGSPKQSVLPSCNNPSTRIQQLQLVVNFPWKIRTIGEDLSYIEGSLRLRSDSPESSFIQANLARIREFLQANDVRARLARCLAEILRVYYVTVRGEDETIIMLATESYREVNECLQHGFTLRWIDDLALSHYVQQLSDLVLSFVQAVQQVREKTGVVLQRIKTFHGRGFHPEAIVQHVRQIRNILESLSLGCDYAHLWIQRTQPLLDAALREQVKFLLHSWAMDFRSMRYDARFLDRDAETGVFHLKPLRVRMWVSQREIRLETPEAAWRSHWIAELNRHFTWIHALPRFFDEDMKPIATSTTSPHAADACAGLTVGQNAFSPYVHIVERIPAYVFEEALSLIEECISDAVAVEKEWRQNQQLLNLDIGVMQYRFGNSLKRWNEAILLIRRFAHEMMDYTQPNVLVGGIVILAEDAQLELGRKIDQANLYMYNKFKDVLQTELSCVFQSISKEKSKLEALDVTSNMKDAATFLCNTTRIKREMEGYEGRIGLMAEAEANLQRFSYAFPEHWVHVSAVKEEYVALKDTFERRLKALEFRRPFLMQYVQDTVKELEANIKSVECVFESLESKIANRAPAVAQQIIANLYDQATQLNEEAKRMLVLQEILGIIPCDISSLTQLLCETEQLKGVWDAVAVDLAELDTLGATPFFEMVPRHLQEALQVLQAKVANYPPRYHHYQVYQKLLRKLTALCGHRRLMQDLRSDAMSPLEREHRHWLSLKQRLHVPWVLSSLLVRDIWESNLEANAAVYHEVIETAQGERRIEIQLHQIEAYWYDFRFSLTPYRIHVGLVRGWDTVFERLVDDLATFSGMRASPYFSSQQIIDMTNGLEGRLNRLRQVLETLLEVQKRWVYLDAIFRDNFEIRQQIPRDAMQFERASRELQQVFPRVRADGALPNIGIDFFLEDTKLLSTLERLQGQLTAVQRALTLYLDTQRDRFPRFFFLGDDDLLEILGNSKDPYFMSKHLRKMFTGVTNFLLDGPNVPGSQNLCGFASLEGEQVLFQTPIEFKMKPICNWLSQAQSGVVATLRESTAQAATQLMLQGEVTLEWLARFPTQAVALALQLWWVQIQEKMLLKNDVVTIPKLTTTVEAIPSSIVIETMNKVLTAMSRCVLTAELSKLMRYKCEQVITVGVYQRDASRALALKKVTSSKDFEWIRLLRFYLVAVDSGSSSNAERSQDLECRMANAVLLHAFEYTGTHERLVQTLLTDKCYLTLMQALHLRLGGSPVGPAGTGKTETVKALGMQLGRHVLVFNCDDAFDFRAVSRIFLGLCQVGAWGCFDEFNRLEERILSALSQQVQVIQESLRAQSKEIELNNYCVPLHDNVAIFITMNPSYAGRSNLPSNLKQLFLNITMIAPDRQTIAEVMLFAQGFHSAEKLSAKIVPLFRLFENQFSRQDHYDFGLRALKSVLVAAGERKRRWASASQQFRTSIQETEEERECTLLLESIITSIAPRLVSSDVVLFYPLLRDFFPDHVLPELPMRELRAAISEVCEVCGLSREPEWVEKVCQLRHTKNTRHGIMIVGPCGAGKTMAWKTLMAAMVRINRFLEIEAYVIDPKVMTKAELFGHLDVTTREWKDGVFTSIFRKVLEIEQQIADRGNEINRTAVELDEKEGDNGDTRELSIKEYWVIFDGDVDPEWVENLNSVLDDNKVLTLPNGERLPLPPSMRIMFETQSLRYATPATVSRCGMVWIEGVISLPSVLAFGKHQLQCKPVVDTRGCRVRWNLAEDMVGLITNYSDGSGSEAAVVGQRSKMFGAYVVSSQSTSRDKGLGIKEDVAQTPTRGLTSSTDPEWDAARGKKSGPEVAPAPMCRKAHPLSEQIKQSMVKIWSEAFGVDGLILKGLMLILHDRDSRYASIMKPNALQLIESILVLLVDGIWRMFSAEQKGEVVLTEMLITRSAKHILEYAVFWGLGASMSYAHRSQLAAQLALCPRLEGQTRDIFDLEVNYLNGEWKAIEDHIVQVEILADEVGINDTVIPTIDTCRHESLLLAWLGSGRSTILCGPPGSGKTMTITSLLNNSSEYDAVFLSFSSGTGVRTILKSLEQHCRVQNTARGLVMTPASGKRLLLFCDEINLPQLNQYGTEVVSQLLRQIIERSGFYRASDNAWVTIEDIQVVGACNPPTDAGRVPLSPRLLRWLPVLFVDFPTPDSLLAVYTTYCRAILQFSKNLQGDYPIQLARAIVNMYDRSRKQFLTREQPHYLYSPRELSRWVRGIYEGFSTWEEESKRSMTAEQLVRLAVHEGLRIFADRLVTQAERDWTDLAINESFMEIFHDLDASVYDRPMLYSTLLSHVYADSPRDELRVFLRKKMSVFSEEEMSTSLVVLDTVIDHVVRIDRILRQPLGHVLLAGSSGVGKTIISRFVAWLGGYSAFWLNVHRNYDLEDFEADLRELLYRAGCKRERVCFIFDESNVMKPSFLEYMNGLLASGEVPGLFDGDEWLKLLQNIREATTTTSQVQYYSSTGTAATSTATRMAGAAPTAASYIDSTNEQELYRWFLRNVKEQLHVVFTLNPSSSAFPSHAMASPALFNRSTVDWFGDWDVPTLKQIAHACIQEFAFLPVCGNAKDVKGFESEQDAHEAVVQAFCDIHHLTQAVSKVAQSRQESHGIFITPRHFTRMISNFTCLLQEKQTTASEQLQHLSDGLHKLGETSDDIAAQQRELFENEKRMAESSKAAQKMLDRIITATDVAQREKAAAEEMRKQLQQEQVSIDENALKMNEDLQKVEPALQSAEAALKTVKTEHLREIRAYTTPPPMVKRTLEAVCALMNESNSEDWDVLKGFIRRDDFLSSVISFQSQRITDAARNRVAALMNDSKFTVEAAYRASKAAGPLLQWVVAQIQYFEARKRVAPIRSEIARIVKERSAKVIALEKIEIEIKQKEASLLQLKEDYGKTTQEIAELKQNIAAVSAKCERANTILGQLLEERGRWEEEVSNFDQEACTTLGNCIVSAAFLAYIGIFEESMRREILLPRWVEEVGRTNNIPVRPHLSVSDYLVSLVERLRWEESGLSKDLLCIENAVIMERCRNDYPLLLDPTNAIILFLKNYYAKQTITNASFGRPGYLKHLEMAMRFGYPIILEDAELLDPAVRPLLNQEFRRLGGRILIRIGSQDVDLSPSFRLFLVTRDVNFHNKVSLTGQVNLINFTVTPSLLQSQCLHRILLHERQDIVAKRTELLNLQGSYNLKLRVLEQKLLTSIAESQGSLLENDALIKSLAQLKREAASIKSGLDDSESVLTSMGRVEARYGPVAMLVSRIFFALKRFSDLSPFYRYNERFLFRVIDDSLAALPKKRNPCSSIDTIDVQPVTKDSEQDKSSLLQDTQTEDESFRIARLVKNIFTLIHHRAGRGMFQEDHLVLALRLAQLWSSMMGEKKEHTNSNKWKSHEETLRNTSLTLDGSAFPDTVITKSEWDWLLEGLHGVKGGLQTADKALPQGSAGAIAVLPLPKVLLESGLIESVSPNSAALQQLLSKTAFKEIRKSMESCSSTWQTFLNARNLTENLEQLLETCFPSNTAPVRKLFLLTLLLLYIRQDYFSAAAHKLLREFFRDEDGDDAVGSFFSHLTPSIPEVLPELSSSTPLVLVTDAIYDPSSKLEQAARDMGMPLRVMAMGSTESTVYADNYLQEGTKTGCWVLLQNMHLARTYLDSVERYLHHQESSSIMHAGFRLFLTIERGASEERSPSIARVCRSSEKVRKQSSPISVSFLEKSIIMVYEAPPGIKSALLQTYGSFSETAFTEKEAIRTLARAAARPLIAPSDLNMQMQRLYLAAAWLHGVIVERVSYVPLGWSQRYEYTDTHYLRTVQAILTWTKDEETAHPSSCTEFVRPVVDWNALRRIVATTVYGGRICNPFDEHVLNILCDRVLDPVVFNKNHCFVSLAGDEDGAPYSPTLAPSSREAWTRKDLLEWIESLPEGSSDPRWLGLPCGVSHMKASRCVLETMQRLATVQTELHQDSFVIPPAQTMFSYVSFFPELQWTGAVVDTQWKKKLEHFYELWHPILSKELGRLSQHDFIVNALELADAEGCDKTRVMQVENSMAHRWHTGLKSSPTTSSSAQVLPLILAVQREAVALVKLLRHAQSDLSRLGKVCWSKQALELAHRTLVEEIIKDRVPSTWSAHMPTNEGLLHVSPWLNDVQSRTQHLFTLVSMTVENKLHQMPIALGLLCFPGAFLTAFKQQFAREKKYPLEQLHPKLEFMAENESFEVTNSGVKEPRSSALYFTKVTLFSAFVNEQGLAELVRCHARPDSVTSSALTPLHTSVGFHWTWALEKRCTTDEAAFASLGAQLASQQPSQSCVTIPLYSTHLRDEMLEVVSLPIVPRGELDKWYESGVCMAAWKPNE